MWGTSGLDEDHQGSAILSTKHFFHGMLREDTLAVFPWIEHHDEVALESVARLCHAWEHSHSELVQSIYHNMKQLLPQARYEGLENLMATDGVPSGQAEVLPLVCQDEQRLEAHGELPQNQVRWVQRR